jgi:HEAT repeat protein
MSHHNVTVEQGNAIRISSLIRSLDDSDGLKRRDAREELEQIGKPATPYLIKALDDASKRVRWEAAKALVAIKDSRAAPALVNSLMDEVFEIQWLAAEALIALGTDSVVPLLKKLITDYRSLFLRQGAHHVLHDLEKKNLLDPETQDVVDDLRCIEPMEPFPYRAKRALDSLLGEEARHATSTQ